MNTDSNNIKGGKPLLYILVKAVFILSCIMLFTVITNPSSLFDEMYSSRIARARSTVDSLCLSLEQYKNDMGQYPATNDSRMVMHELTGYKASDKKIDILYSTNALWNGPYFAAKRKEFKDGKLNEALIDPWGSPYCFDFLWIKSKTWSWGPNKKNEYGMGDDITSWVVPGKSPVRQRLARFPVISIILFVITGILILIMKYTFRSKLK
jgi:hypothetical protein